MTLYRYFSFPRTLCQILANQETMMAGLADITALLKTETDDETKLVAALQQFVTTNASLTTQLQQAVANSDPTALKSVADQMTANNTAMETALASLPTPPAPAPAP